MYDIMNLNIWKDSTNRDLFKCKEAVIETDVSMRKEFVMSELCQSVFNEIRELVPSVDFREVKMRRGGKLRFPIYINEKLKTTDLEALDLTVRSSNCLHRAGYRTIGDLVESIESSEDLKKIRNCGAKSVDEIMEKLFCYQYTQVSQSGKLKYINRLIELNR